ncbi:MAG TPA: LysR substrate-binding domain-containing protein [Burkholderiaceae bacterium]|nr:LysR substrate-binding domain-containing protein [Burkholderiaceae bacterium]
MATRTVPRRPPARRRPIQLNGLRGFEAAARLLSFTRAAAALHLTQSSLSRQAAALERQVGKALFVRRTRALALTPAGERLQRAVQQALALVDQAVDDVRGVVGPPRVSLTTYASFASLWLVPRLVGFQRANPAVEFRIDASDRRIDLDVEGVDLALRWGRPDDVPASALVLHHECITPALSPALRERCGLALRDPSELLLLPLVEMEDGTPQGEAGSWARWLAHANVAGEPARGKLIVSYIDQSIQAAVRGQGVVLGRSPFLADSLASGELVAPFPELKMATGYCHYLVENGRTRATAQVAAFRDWLVDQFRQVGSAPSADAPGRHAGTA